MIAPGNGHIQVVLAIAFVIASGYALGRIHQWYRDSARREQAYRHGYDLASNSMFDMTMTRRAAGRTQPAGPPQVAAPSPVPVPRFGNSPYEGEGGSHRAPTVGTSRRRIKRIQSDYLEHSKAV